MTSRQLESLLQHGTKHREPVDLSELNGPEDVMVRPLSAAEASEVEREMMTGMKASTTVDGPRVNATPMIDDLGVLMDAQKTAKVKAVAYALSHSGETCQLEQARQLPSTWIDALARVVFRISGISSGDEDSFRVGLGVDGSGEEDGSGDVGAVAGGDPSGADAGGPDQAPA